MYEDFDLNLDDYRSDHDRLEKRNVNDKRFLYPPKDEGVLIVRFLPPAPGEKLYCATRLHYLNGRNFHCLRNYENGKWRGDCPICDRYNELFELSKKAKSEDEVKALQALGRSLKPIEKNYWNAIARTLFDKESQKTKTNDGPFILPMGKTLQQIVLRGIFGDEKLQEPPLGNIAHPLKGRDFKVAVTIKNSPDGRFPEYSKSKFLDISPLGTPDQVKEWLANLHPLRSLREENLKTWDELQHQLDIFSGKAKDEDTSFNYNRQAGNHDVPFEVSESKHVAEAPKLNLDEDSNVAEDEFIRELQATLGR